MKHYLILGFLLVVTFSCKTKTSIKALSPKVHFENIKTLIGSWEGTLTYLDYRTNEPFSMPANLVVDSAHIENILLLRNIFPNESSANNTDTLRLSSDGLLLNDQKIVSVDQLASGQTQIITEYLGEDNNKKATINHIHLIGAFNYSDSKKVKFEDSDEWILRSEFKYKRK